MKKSHFLLLILSVFTMKAASALTVKNGMNPLLTAAVEREVIVSQDSFVKYYAITNEKGKVKFLKPGSTVIAVEYTSNGTILNYYGYLATYLNDTLIFEDGPHIAEHSVLSISFKTYPRFLDPLQASYYFTTTGLLLYSATQFSLQDITGSIGAVVVIVSVVYLLPAPVVWVIKQCVPKSKILFIKGKNNLRPEWRRYW